MRHLHRPRRLPLGTLALLMALCGCGSPSSTTTNTGATAASGESSAATEESDVTLPANLHVVVFFDTERGHEHLDVRVISDASGTFISGVRADESRAQPITRRIDLTGELLREYTARIAALANMPRCEPLARFPGEPLFRIESPEHHDEGPSLWLRENGNRMIASDDPCLGYPRIAHFVYTTWMSQNF